MSSEIEPKRLVRLKIGRFEWSLYGRPRQKPIPELAAAAAAIEELKQAIFKELSPIFEPILDWMNRRLSRWSRWLNPVCRWTTRIAVAGCVLCFAFGLFMLLFLKFYP